TREPGSKTEPGSAQSSHVGIHAMRLAGRQSNQVREFRTRAAQFETTSRFASSCRRTLIREDEAGSSRAPMCRTPRAHSLAVMKNRLLFLLLVTVGLVCAFGTTVLSLAIPIVIKRAIDDSIAPTNGHRAALWPYLLVVLVLALVRFAVNFTRRYATSRTGIRVEARMRELLYQAYLRYPRAFYDRHATGQVVSRATNDLYPIRYFIGWGMTQGLQSLMMIVGIATVLFLVN